MRALNRFINCSEELTAITGQAVKPCVVIMGSFNSGKSTLLNRLLGEEISPVRVLPTTSRLLYFDYGSSFKASFTGAGDKMVFLQRAQFHAFLDRLKSPGGRVDIELPSPVLKKCRLVDTPGFDYLSRDSGRLAELAAREADKVIYLFHQRGIEEMNRLFLYKLASIWKNKNRLNDISFWVNCNLGQCDGTSLESTLSALREIFLSQVRLNIINTYEQKDIDALRLFLEVELARETFRHVSANLKKTDGELSERIKRTARVKDDSIFLSEFWAAQEVARTLLEVGRLLHSLPSVLKKLDTHLNFMTRANLGPETEKPGGRPYRPRVAGIRENKENLLDLLQSLLNEKQMESFLDRARLEEICRKIEEKRFTVVATGGFSTGKSTFFNALLKEELLPVGDGPTTAAVTRITYGSKKTATVHTPLQVTLKVQGNIGNKALLRREELAALERWLACPGSGVAFLEACVDGRFKHVDRQEIAVLLNNVKEAFAAGGSPTVPAVFRLLPLKGLKEKRLLQQVRVTFKNAGASEFNLSDPVGIKEFRKAVGPAHAFGIELVDIRHPAEFLKLAEFVDTPGLDWIQKHHYESTCRHIRRSEAHLFFFNAKHVLNDMDRDSFQRLFWSRAVENVRQGGISSKEEENIFFIVNFADTLDSVQSEAVYNFVWKNLTAPTATGSPVFVKPKIFLLSALKSLGGEDGGRMKALLHSLEEGILKYRGRDFYLSMADEAGAALACALEKINGNDLAGSRKARELLREAKRKLKDIRKTIYNPGRL